MNDPTKCRLMDKQFRYVPAASTNVAATFQRIRRQMKQAEEAAKQSANVKQLRKAR